MNEIDIKEDNAPMVIPVGSKSAYSTICVHRLLQVIDYPAIIDVDGQCFEYSCSSDALASLVKLYLLNRIAV